LRVKEDSASGEAQYAGMRRTINLIKEHSCQKEIDYFDFNCQQRLLIGGYLRFNWNFNDINRDWQVSSPTR
jgi:hypothetical protein